MLNEKDKKIFKVVIITTILIVVGVIIKEIFLTPQLEFIYESLIFVPNVDVDFDFLESEPITDLTIFNDLTLPEIFGRQRPFEPY